MTVTNAPTKGLVDELRAIRPLPAPSVARAIRVAAGATQRQVAGELGVDRVTVARWELGMRTPRGALRTYYEELLDDLREIGDV